MSSSSSSSSSSSISDKGSSFVTTPTEAAAPSAPAAAAAATDPSTSSAGGGGTGEENKEIITKNSSEGADPLVIDEASSEDVDEKEFEPSVEMMINDFDDERTLEEEEAMENQGDESEELTALEQEQDMPLEVLLKMYGYGGASAGEGEGGGEGSGAAGTTTTESKENVNKSEEGGNEAEDEDESEDDDEDEEKSDRKEVEEQIDEDDDDDDEDDDEHEQRNRKKRGPEPPAAELTPSKKAKSELAKFYEAAVESRSLRSTTGSGGQVEEEEEEDEDDGGDEGGGGSNIDQPDSDLEGRDFSWKKTIMIGPSYQVVVPTGLSKYQGDALPYENEDKQLWDPKQLGPDEVEEYLAKCQETLQACAANNSNVATSGVNGIPVGTHIRDDEQALFLLLQCGYNYDEALRRRRMNAVPPADTMSLWSEEECRAFELGLRLYGKDFTMIQQQKVRTRSVGELVQFYYLWKKTERHDVFATSTRLEKKKYTLHPGTTDYMDRFIDEQDPTRDRSSSPNYHSLIYGTQQQSSSALMTTATPSSSAEQIVANVPPSSDVPLNCVRGGGGICESSSTTTTLGSQKKAHDSTSFRGGAIFPTAAATAPPPPPPPPPPPRAHGHFVTSINAPLSSNLPPP